MLEVTMAAIPHPTRVLRYRNWLLIIAAAALAVTLVAAWVVTAHPVANIDDAKLDSYRKSLLSNTREAEMLAYQMQHGRATGHYADISAQNLYASTSDTAAKLQTETPEHNTTQQVRAVADTANNLSAALVDLSQSPDQPRLQQIIGRLHMAEQELQPS
jgi:hypothetical protein